MIYIITYDLNQFENSSAYTKIIDAIEKCGIDSCKILKSAFLVKSNLSASEVYAKLQSFIDLNDQIIISEITKNTAGWLNEDDVTWIHKNLMNVLDVRTVQGDQNYASTNPLSFSR